MMVTAAGTIQPARVFVIGAGVAGLQAIATARRLGAIVEAYDTRPAVREQVESLGARFVELDLEGKDAQDAGGYAQRADRGVLPEAAPRARQAPGADSDVVITTALVPGQRAPLLIDADGGARHAARLGDRRSRGGAGRQLRAVRSRARRSTRTACGSCPARNLPSDVPTHASQLYARNLVTFLKHLAPKGELVLDLEDEITRGSLLTQQGAIANDRVKALAQNAPSARGSARGRSRGALRRGGSAGSESRDPGAASRVDAPARRRHVRRARSRRTPPARRCARASRSRACRPDLDQHEGVVAVEAVRGELRVRTDVAAPQPRRAALDEVVDALLRLDALVEVLVAREHHAHAVLRRRAARAARAVALRAVEAARRVERVVEEGDLPGLAGRAPARESAT